VFGEEDDIMCLRVCSSDRIDLPHRHTGRVQNVKGTLQAIK